MAWGGGGGGTANPAEAAARALKAKLDAFATEAGYGGVGSIPEWMTFRQWCEDLAAKGLKIDRKPFRLDDRPALVPIYDAIPTTREEAFQLRLVIQKATQLGLTVWEVLADIYMARKWGPVNIGLYCPAQKTAREKSEIRFMGIVRSAPELRHAMSHRKDPDGALVYVGEGNVETRYCLESLLFFSWTSGKVTTESMPMDIVSLDEVQGMTLTEIDKVLARMGDSAVQFAMLLSTAFMPSLDINFWYLRGSQEVWHTVCLTCERESDLSDPVSIFPDLSIGYNTGGDRYKPLIDQNGRHLHPPTDEYVWTCPHCGGWIPDPQFGRYVPQNAGADRKIKSFLLPRTISPKITPRQMVNDFRHAKTGDQKQSFFNRQLARPFIDPSQLPVTIQHCEDAAKEGKRAGLRWETKAEKGVPYYMGIDQMGGWCAIVIKKRMRDGRQGVVHVEAHFSDDPFKRCTELMHDFNIRVCVLEQLPNANDARRFANHRHERGSGKEDHVGRVFLNTSFNSSPSADMVSWGDMLSRSDRRTSEEDRERYSVALSQYKAMQSALYRVRNLQCLFPSDTLDQDVIENKRTRRINVVRDWVWNHFTKTALVIDLGKPEERERKPKAKVHKIEIDPHFSFAAMLCEVAWVREQGMGSILMPPDGAPDELKTETAKKLAEAMPGLAKEVLAIIDETPPGTCGRCASYPLQGDVPLRECAARAPLTVRPRDAACPLFTGRKG